MLLEETFKDIFYQILSTKSHVKNFKSSICLVSLVEKVSENLKYSMNVIKHQIKLCTVDSHTWGDACCSYQNTGC